MTRSARRSVAILCLPFAAGCFTVAQVPVPTTAPEREALPIRGVVVREAGGGEEVVRFREIHDATWTPTAYSVVADVDNGTGRPEMVTRLFPISTMSGLLVRQLNAGRTSAIIGGFFVAAAGIIAALVTGHADQY